MSDFVPTAVLLTGGLGFIGSHLARLLLETFPAVKVVILDRHDYCARPEYVDDLLRTQRLKIVKGDVASRDLVRELMVSHAIDTVCHLAAQTHVDLSFGNSMEFIQSNIVGTHTLLEVALELQPQIKRFLHTSTDEVYGSSEAHGENHSCKEGSTMLFPGNPYSATKAAAELLVSSFVTSFRLPCVVVRPNNIMGPHQFPDKLIPKFILKLIRQEKLCIHGSGLQKRSFLYVKDAVRGFLTVLQRGQLGEIYNLGLEQEQTVLEVAESLCQLLRPGEPVARWLEHHPDRAFQDMRYMIDSSKVQRLGWKPQHQFADALRETVRWYQDHAVLYEDEQNLAVHPVDLTPRSKTRQLRDARTSASVSSNSPTSSAHESCDSPPLPGSPLPPTLSPTLSPALLGLRGQSQ